MTAEVRNLPDGQCVLIGQNSHWAGLAATTALLLPAVVGGVDLTSARASASCVRELALSTLKRLAPQWRRSNRLGSFAC